MICYRNLIVILAMNFTSPYTLHSNVRYYSLLRSGQAQPSSTSPRKPPHSDSGKRANVGTEDGPRLDPLLDSSLPEPPQQSLHLHTSNTTARTCHKRINANPPSNHLLNFYIPGLNFVYLIVLLRHRILNVSVSDKIGNLL